MNKQKLLVIGLVFLCSLLAGCNTVRGMGEDLEKGGEAIQKAANK